MLANLHRARSVFFLSPNIEPKKNEQKTPRSQVRSVSHRLKRTHDDGDGGDSR